MQKFGDKIVMACIYLVVIGFALICLFPLLMALAVSFSDEQSVLANGYQLIPDKWSLDAYSYFILGKGMTMLRSYGVSVFVLVAGVSISMITTVCYAYSSSVKGFRGANILSFFAYFTMLFSGGMLPWYIMCTRYYHLNNNILGLILPASMNVFNMYLMRNFFRTIPSELAEAARVDGAGQMQIFFKVMLPLSKVGLVTIAMFYALSFWNDWYLALMLITDDTLYPVQYLLYIMMTNANFLATSNNATMAQYVVVPTQTAQMAMTCIAIGPIVLVYPLVQRYFVRGITLGAVKG